MLTSIIFILPRLSGCYSDFTIYTNEIGCDTFADSKLNMSLYHETPLTVEGMQITICGEGIIFDLSFLPEGDKKQTQASLESIKALAEGKIIRSGHYGKEKG